MESTLLLQEFNKKPLKKKDSFDVEMGYLGVISNRRGIGMKDKRKYKAGIPVLFF
jgi:hypothetical protein